MMPDREKVINGLRSIKTYLASQAIESTDDFAREGFIESQRDIDDEIELLKEQEDLGTELTNAVELIHKKNERIEKLLKEQKFVVDSDGKITPLPVVVRCRDCKKRDSWECWQYFFGRIKIPDDWFCADGVKRNDLE